MEHVFDVGFVFRSSNVHSIDDVPAGGRGCAGGAALPLLRLPARRGGDVALLRRKLL